MNELTYKLVPMAAEHLDEIAEIEKACFSLPWTVEMLRSELFSPSASFIVAESEDGHVLGYAGMNAILDEGYIDNIAVRPEFRRKGIAGALLEVFCRFGASHLAFLTLEVRAGNEAAIGLYEKHGFTEVGRRRDYYEKPREDAVLMTRRFREVDA